MRRPDLYIPDILSWIDVYRRHWHEWPTRDSGPVSGQIDVTWCGIDLALRKGNRGLPGGSSLAQLLAQYRGVRNRMRLPRLTEKGILKWIDAERRRSGRCPNINSGAIPESPGDTWSAIDRALRSGHRGLPGGDSLARLLARRRHVRNLADLPRLSKTMILTWADPHYQRTGHYPTRDSGLIPEAPGETWQRIANDLAKGFRGLRPDSLARLLQRHRGVRNRKALPPLRIHRIVVWASKHRAKKGEWPTHLSGPVLDAPGETWGGINTALQRGQRGLPGGSSLYRVLRRYLGVDRKVRNATRTRVG
jgi:hypothetical protein